MKLRRRLKYSGVAASPHEWMICAEDNLCHFWTDETIGGLAFGEQSA